MAVKARAVFLDRDGTLNHMIFDESHGIVDSPFSLKHFHLKPGVGKFIAKLNNEGFKVIVITNQPGIAKGSLTEKMLKELHNELEKEIALEKGYLDGIYYCPHHFDKLQVRNIDYYKKCDCRKPLPGLILKAAKEHNIDLAKSYMVGDGITDIAAGKSAGCRTILISNLKLDLLEIMLQRSGSLPDILVGNLDDALEDILSGQIIHPFLFN